MENVMPRAKANKSVEDFKKFLDEAVSLVAGESSGVIESQAEEVHVAIVFNVTGFGRHPAAIYADQNRFHASTDGALEEAHGLLEEWEQEHYPSDDEHRTETFEGRTWTLPASAFVDAVYGTDIEKFIDVEDESESAGDDEDEVGEVRETPRVVSEPNDARDILEGLGPYMKHEGHDAPRESARIARMIASAGRSGKKAEAVLEEVDKLINGHGVEAIRDENAYDSYYGDVIAEYVNTGDTYTATLLYDVREHTFHVTSYGDWYEAYEAERDSEDDEEEPEDEEDEDE